MTRIQEVHAPEIYLGPLFQVVRYSTTNFEYLSKVADFNPEDLGTEEDDDVGDDDDQEILVDSEIILT